MKTMTKQDKSQQGVNVLVKAMLLTLMFLVGGMESEAWLQGTKEPANSIVDGYSGTWLRVWMTEALPSITDAKVTI